MATIGRDDDDMWKVHKEQDTRALITSIYRREETEPAAKAHADKEMNKAGAKAVSSAFLAGMASMYLIWQTMVPNALQAMHVTGRNLDHETIGETIAATILTMVAASKFFDGFFQKRLLRREATKQFLKDQDEKAQAAPFVKSQKINWDLVSNRN